MSTSGVILLVLASAFTAHRARQRGPAAARLRWLSLGLAAVALGLALWAVVQTMGEHRRADAAPASTASPFEPAPERVAA